MRVWILFFLYGVLILAAKSVFTLPGNFLLMAVVFFGFQERGLAGLGLSLMLGFMLDTVSLSPAGTALFSFGIVFGIIRFVRTKILFQTLSSRFFWIMVFSLVNMLVTLLYSGLVGDGRRPLHLFLPRLFVGALVDGALGLFWVPVLSWYHDLKWNKLFHRPDILLKK